MRPSPTSQPIDLYLRPFDSDGRIEVSSPLFLLKSLGSRRLLIAMGEKTVTIGAGSVVVSNDNWQETFVRLANKAECIFCVPSLHKGTIWELKWLSASSLFAKVVMIFTPLHFMGSQLYDHTQLCETLHAMGWRLPTDLTSSSLVAFRSTGDLAKHTPNSSFKRRNIVALAKVISSSG
jgi:hypothetical protein